MSTDRIDARPNLAGSVRQPIIETFRVGQFAARNFGTSNVYSGYVDIYEQNLAAREQFSGRHVALTEGPGGINLARPSGRGPDHASLTNIVYSNVLGWVPATADAAQTNQDIISSYIIVDAGEYIELERLNDQHRYDIHMIELIFRIQLERITSERRLLRNFIEYWSETPVNRPSESELDLTSILGQSFLNSLSESDSEEDEE